MVGPDDDLDELKEEVSEGFDARRSLQFLATSDGSEGSTGCKQQPFFCPEFGQNTQIRAEVPNTRISKASRPTT